MPVTNDREYRRIEVANLETRDAEGGGMIVEGYATTFNDEYELYSGRDFRLMESVDPHAFDGCEMGDVIMQYDHAGRVFARTKNGTLQLNADEHGLHMRADLSGTDIGRQLYQEIRGGYTDKMSFGFRIANGGETRRDETVEGVTVEHRRITAVSKLFDVSAVSLPANDATEISVRNLCDGAIARIEQERLAEQARARKVQRIKILLEVESNDN